MPDFLQEHHGAFLVIPRSACQADTSRKMDFNVLPSIEKLPQGGLCDCTPSVVTTSSLANFVGVDEINDWVYAFELHFGIGNKEPDYGSPEIRLLDSLS